MLDENTAGIGHNKPPSYDLEAFSAHKEKVDEFLGVTKQWLDLEAIKTPEHAEQVTDQIDGLRKLWTKIDNARKGEKKPHDVAGQEVQDAFNPLLKKVKTAGDKLKPKLATYASEKAAEAERAKAAQEAEAKRLADEAAEELRKAEESNDIGAQIEAEEKAAQAEESKKLAAKKVTTQVRSASGAGRTMSVRKVKEVEITNANLLFMAVRDDPVVQEALKTVATRIVRAAGYDDGPALAGVKVNIRETVA